MKVLKELLKISSVSGGESSISDYLTKIFNNLGLEVKKDNLNNVIAVRKGKNEKLKVLIDAHYDTVGLMVTDITEGGFVKFTSVGGIDNRILPALKVSINGKEKVKGVIGVKPPHLLKDGSDKSYNLDDLFIDTGYDIKTLKALISIGDTISFDTEYEELLNDKIAGSGLDDKIGVYTLYKILEKINNDNISVYGITADGEETGLRGAKAVSEREEFDLAIVIDVTFGITPDAKGDESFPVGKGAVITLGPSLSKKYNDILREKAKENNIPYNIEVAAGHPGTNAWVYHSAGISIPTVMISIPLKYMHNPYEIISKKDVDDVINLTLCFLNSLGREENYNA